IAVANAQLGSFVIVDAIAAATALCHRHRRRAYPGHACIHAGVGIRARALSSVWEQTGSRRFVAAMALVIARTRIARMDTGPGMTGICPIAEQPIVAWAVIGNRSGGNASAGAIAGADAARRGRIGAPLSARQRGARGDLAQLAAARVAQLDPAV